MVLYHFLIVHTFIWISLFSLFCNASSQQEVTEQCLSNKLAGKRFRQVNQDAPMYLTLGHYGIETMNALSFYQMRQITFLAECVAELVPHLFITTKENDTHYEKYGGNNVTYMNNLFSKILPTLKQHILHTAKHSISQSAWKHKPLPSNYGIRSTYMLSTERQGIELFIEMLREKSERTRNWEKVKLPIDVDPSLYHRFRSVLMMNKTEEENYRQRFITDHVGSDLTIVVMLSDAKNSCRGDYLHLIDENELLSPVTSHSEYDDEDEGSPSSKTKKALLPSSAYIPSIIDNFMPEKGSILTLRGRHHGPEEVVCGQRQVLVLELWKFQDAPLPLSPETMGEMLSEEEGAALGLAAEDESITNGNDENTSGRNEL